MDLVPITWSAGPPSTIPQFSLIKMRYGNYASKGVVTFNPTHTLNYRDNAVHGQCG